MNLIEQLGGYERAKYEFEMIKEMKPIYPDEVETNDRMLLGYRREHGIFEVGDTVVFRDAEKFKSNLLSVAHVELSKLLDIHSKLNGYSDFCNIRHATDQEIKAGKRLEVENNA